MNIRVTNIIFSKAWFILGLALFLTFATSLAHAQNPQELDNRLRRLENEIQTISRTVYRGEAPPAGAFEGSQNQANTEVRLQQLEIELRNITGRLEEQDYQIQQVNQKLDRVLSDMQIRLQDIEQGAGPSDGASMRFQSRAAARGDDSSSNFQWSSRPEQESPAAGGTLGQLQVPPASGSVSNVPASIRAPVEGDPALNSGAAAARVDEATGLYENAFARLRGGQYDQAESDFNAFLQQYPDHPLTGNAQYWLGETYYARGNFEAASREFATGYQKFPQGTKAPDNLLKLALSLEGLGNKDDACVALSQLTKEFSNPGPVIRRANDEKQRLGCAA